MKFYNRLLSDMHNDKTKKVLKVIIGEFNKRGWYPFWRELQHYIASQDHTVVAIPPLVSDAPNILEVETDKVYTFRKIDELTKRDRTISKKNKLIIEMILKGMLTKRLLKGVY